MKKTLLLGLLAFAGLSANAQIANGTAAPDFTATDINDVEHTLSDYLNEGKTVVMDISATWCGPCWSFHSTHALEDLYNAYGPGGSDEIVVIFVEGDNATPLENLYGVNVSGAPATQGNWVEGVSYPIINNGNISNQYNLEHFPTLLRICPDGIMYEINPGSASSIRSSINTNCAGVSLTGVQNHAKISAADVRMCGTTTGSTQALFRNYGTNAITAATAVLKNSEGEVVATQTFAGTVNQFANGTINFDNVTFETEGTYTVEFTDINGNAPFSNEIAVNSMEVTISPESFNNIQVNVYTDNYPSEISFDIKDSNGTTVASGGPYQAGTEDQWGGGGPDANTTKTHFFTLPEGIDCYTVVLNDEFGDGWKYGSTPHGLEVLNLAEGGGNASVVNIEVADFGNTLEVDSAFKTKGLLDNDTFETSNFAVYPNPTSGILNFATQEAVNVTVMDITGKVVFTAKEINNGDSINLSSLQAGVYVAKINGQNSERIEKIVIK